jgi:hypothetical protein
MSLLARTTRGTRSRLLPARVRRALSILATAWHRGGVVLEEGCTLGSLDRLELGPGGWTVDYYLAVASDGVLPEGWPAAAGLLVQRRRAMLSLERVTCWGEAWQLSS